MGRATRWLKSMFGIKIKEKETREYSGGDRKDWSQWVSGRSDRDGGVLINNPATIPPNITPAEAAWLKSFYSASDKEQSKHAIAVAAASAAAADAAVAAAQAAVAVVRLTNQGRGAVAVDVGRERSGAAVKIQKLFRGYLARKALRALRGLVKIQALVRGYLVRRRTTATLHSMQALIRAQASVRAWKTRRCTNNQETFAAFQARKSLEKSDDPRMEHPMALHSRRLSATFDHAVNTLDECPKIVEMDTGCGPKSRPRRGYNTWISDPGEDSNRKAAASPFHSRIPARILIPDGLYFPDKEWVMTGDDERHSSTAQCTPRFYSCSCGYNAPSTPAKSLCVESYFSPNYMANTQSFSAKLRSQSAPKQRPEVVPKRRLSLHEVMESRNSLNGVRMQRSCSQALQTINFKNVVLGNLGRSSEFVRENRENGLL